MQYYKQRLAEQSSPDRDAVQSLGRGIRTRRKGEVVDDLRMRHERRR